MKRTKRQLHSESVDADIVGGNPEWINVAKEKAEKAKDLLKDAYRFLGNYFGDGAYLMTRLDSNINDLDDTIDCLEEEWQTNKGRFDESGSDETEWFDSRGDMKKHLPMECILDCSGGGSVDDAVDYWLNELNFHAPTEKGLSYVREYGLDDIEPEDIDKYVLWIMCGNIKEDAYEFCRGSMGYDDYDTSEYPEDIKDWSEEDWDRFQDEVAICHLGM